MDAPASFPRIAHRAIRSVVVMAALAGSIAAMGGTAHAFAPSPHMYGSDSPFNRQLPASPTVASDSASVISNLAANNIHFEGGGSQFAFTSDDGRDGVYYSSNADPMVTIHCTYEWGPGTCTGQGNGINIDGQQIPIPAGAMPQNNGSDMHMTVVDQSTDTEYDFEHATWSSDHKTLNVWSGASITSGPNVGTGLGGGGTAADFATLAGLVTAPELASGTINHALVVSIPCTNGYVYPASQSSGFPCSQITNENTTGTAPALGTLLQLNMSDAQIASSGAPRWEQTLMTAMAHYGLYVNDTNGNGDPDDIGIEAESDISYTSLGGQPLMQNFIRNNGGSYWAPLNRWILSGTAIPVNKLRVIDPCFAHNTCTGKRIPSARRATRHGAPIARVADHRAARRPRRRSGHGHQAHRVTVSRHERHRAVGRREHR